VDVVPYLPADPQATKPAQVGECAFQNPVLGTEAGAVFAARRAITGFPS
jgi:hypothetical protein